MLQELKYLLDKITKHKLPFDQQREKEEKFNIFSVMYKDHEEVRLHSRFLAALLNPSGSHGMKKLFLENFIKSIANLDPRNFENAIVYPEEHNKSEYKNIDILIIDRKSRHAIIIENKIYAGDSNSSEKGQLERYFELVRDEEQIPEANISVFYLTLDGHEPSRESLGNYGTLEKIKGRCISYEIDILNWLEDSIPKGAEKPFLREAILQYQNLIKKMTSNEIDIKERLQLKDAIGENESSLETAKYLIDNFKHIKWHTINDFWKELSEALNGFENITIDEKNTKLSPNSITAITHLVNNSAGEEMGIYFKVNDSIKAFVWHEKEAALYWGFERQDLQAPYDSVLRALVNDRSINSNEKYYYQNCTDLEKDEIWLKDFSQTNTFNLINPEIRKNTVDKIAKDISACMAKILAKL